MRRVRYLVLLVLVVVATGCDPVPSATRAYGGDVAERIEQGRQLGPTLARIPAEMLEDQQVVALGYLERSRLGLGSPFRLAEYALSDERLDEPLRSTTAYAILADALDGEGYRVDARVLNGIRLGGRAGRAPPGGYHLALLEEMVRTAPTATAGERAARLAYEIALSEGTLTALPHAVVAHVAAHLADRRRAREDAAALFRAAASRSDDPLELLLVWRADRHFRVEGPAMDEIQSVERVAISDAVPDLLLRLRVLRYQLGGLGVPVRGHVRRLDERPEPRLSAEAAYRLQELTHAFDYPPQAPVAVALMIHGEALRDEASWDDPALARHLTENGWNEERFVAHAAPLWEEDRIGSARVSLTALQAGVFLRAWNQENVWMPGDPGPARRDVEARYGLERITFADDVPESWRPYLLRMLSSGLADLQRVVPLASLRGMSVRFAELEGERQTLAVHDPRTRTLTLPPRTGAGTLAHEAGHDLDWQLARRRYGGRGYATDLSVTHGPGDRIASWVSGLSAALVAPPHGRPPSDHDNRPTEVFARGFDWFIAAALARDGMTGGYLTSFQEPEITGYGSTRGPDVRGDAPAALFAILDAVAPVPTTLREWVVSAHGPARPLDVADGARQILTAGRAAPFADRLEAVVEAHGRARRALDRSACRASSDLETLRGEAAAMRVLDLAGEAAVRGAVRSTAQGVVADRRLDVSPVAVEDWVAWRFGGPPFPAGTRQEIVLRRMDPLVRAGTESIEQMRRYRSPHAAVGWIDPVSGYCATNPFHVPARPF